MQSVSGDWTATIGVGAEYKPDFAGASGSMFSPVPIFSIRRAGSVEQFRGPRDSSGIALFDYGGFRAGPALKFRSARKATDYRELYGLNDVKAAVEVGGFVEYFPVDWLRTRAETRQGFGGHSGVAVDFSADVIIPVLQRFTISAGPRFSWKSQKAISPYFDVGAIESIASGLPVYTAASGAYSAGAGLQVTYRLDPKWELRGYVEYERLLGDVANSPLVALRGSANQTTVGVGISYAFDFKIR